MANVDLDALRINGVKVSADIRPLITDATLTYDIDSGSVLEIVTHDPKRVMLTSAVIVARATCVIDSCALELVHASKQGNEIKYTFEDATMAEMRRHVEPKKVEAGRMSHRDFCISLIKEQSRVKIVAPVNGPVSGQALSRGSVATTGSIEGFSAEDVAKFGGGNKTGNNTYGQDSVSTGSVATASADRVALALTLAIKEQESHGNYQAVNAQSGALGAYQILPSNLPQWAPETIGRKVTNAEFLASADLQDQIAGGKIRALYVKYGAQGAANTWYSGSPGGGDAAQAGGYPSINQYADEVVAKMNELLASSSTAADASSVDFGGGNHGEASGKLASKKPKVDLTPENTWGAIHRIMNGIGWRCFIFRNTVYMMPDSYLIKGKPWKVVEYDEGEGGVDEVNWEFDLGQPQSDLNFQAVIERFSLVPGSVIDVAEQGMAGGLWLVSKVSQNLFRQMATIDATRTQPEIPETADEDSDTGLEGYDEALGFAGLTDDTPSPRFKNGQDVDKMLMFALTQRGKPYVYGAKGPDSWDCSGLVGAATVAAGISDVWYKGQNADGQWLESAKHGLAISVAAALKIPGALLFMADSTAYDRIKAPYMHHVGFSLGDGRTMEARGTAYGVNIFNDGTTAGWTHAALVHGIDYPDLAFKTKDGRIGL